MFAVYVNKLICEYILKKNKTKKMLISLFVSNLFFKRIEKNKKLNTNDYNNNNIN